jgi:hypothetical protein
VACVRVGHGDAWFRQRRSLGSRSLYRVYRVPSSFYCRYKLQGNTVGGVQSLVSVMFMSSLFVGMINLNTSISPGMKNRAVFYRERFSRM